MQADLGSRSDGDSVYDADRRDGDFGGLPDAGSACHAETEEESDGPGHAVDRRRSDPTGEERAEDMRVDLDASAGVPDAEHLGNAGSDGGDHAGQAEGSDVPPPLVTLDAPPRRSGRKTKGQAPDRLGQWEYF